MGETTGAEPTVAGDPAGRGWARHLGELYALVGRAPADALPAVSVTLRLDGRPGEAWRLLEVCAALGRHHGLDLTVRHTGAAATYTVRLRRGADGAASGAIAATTTTGGAR